MLLQSVLEGHVHTNFSRYHIAKELEQDEHGTCDPELDQFRWMVEEFRVSLFAQQLGTSLSVSAKRLEKQWAKVRT